MAESVQTVVSALNVLYENPDASAKVTANAWLQEFQKSDEAWATAQLILFAPDAPLQPKLFAAQTFRTKITYDLSLLLPVHQIALRDSLLTALSLYAPGPRVILTQICLSLASLALQLTPTQWTDPTSSMIELFGKQPEMAGALLEFLQVLAEEYAGNMKIEVKNDFATGKAADGSGQAEKVVALLGMYVTAPGITGALKNQCFACLGSWLKSGHASTASVTGSAILSAAFTSLSDPALFDAAVDLLVDILHEAQELEDNTKLIEEMVPKLIGLQGAVAASKAEDDEDSMRGYTRILVEAGEWYAPLIVQHPDSFLPLVEIILECANFDNLDVVGITLNFWYRLAKGLRKVRHEEKVAPLLTVFEKLMGIIIRHLRYPEDDASLVGQDRDDFRTFRHTIGDTLKDCCSVLGATNCLYKTYEGMMTTLAGVGAAGEPSWQELEAPLFSMRSMGAEVDPNDKKVLHLIMDLLPRLPEHPKLRYAAILVIGRYTEWIERHPEHIQMLLPYVSSGFSSPDSEVSAAAAQTMKYLCKDCPHHLVSFLPQLHSFIQIVSTSLGSEDLLELAEAIAHIIVAMNPEDGPAALSTFCMPNVELIHALASKPTVAISDELKLACAALARLDMYLSVVGSFDGALPPACQGTCEQIWGMLDLFLSKYGNNALVAERTCIVLRRGLQFFDEEAFRVAGTVLGRLTDCFEKAPASSYVWITDKMVTMFASRRDAKFEEVLKNSIDRQSVKIFELLQSTSPDRVSDVLSDYVHLLCDVCEYTPALLFLSPVFPAAFQTILSTLTLLTPETVLAALDTLRAIIGHDCLQYDPSDPNPAPFQQHFPHFAAAIRSIVSSSMPQLVGLLLNGLVMGFEDEASNVLTVFRLLSMQFSEGLAVVVPGAVESLQSKTLGMDERKDFVVRFNTAMQARNPNKVKESFTFLLRASKKGRERSRESTVVKSE